MERKERRHLQNGGQRGTRVTSGTDHTTEMLRLLRRPVVPGHIPGYFWAATLAVVAKLEF